MDHVRLRRLLDEPPASPVWPIGISLRAFTPDDAGAVHALLAQAYDNGGGSVPAFLPWWAKLSADSEYDPALCFTAYASGTLVGTAQCWTSAYVKDLAVHPSWRRRGVATALLLHSFHVFAQRGASQVDLKVETGNGGAMTFYKSLGFISA
jgi:ribosomal protein S18 acetylase RimI-like enzyme